MEAFISDLELYNKKYKKSRLGSKIDTQPSTRNEFAYLAFLFLCMSAIFMVITLRLFNIQVLQAQKYRVLAQNNTIRQVPIVPERGIIFDSKGNQIVQNLASFNLYLDTNLCKMKDCLNTLNDLSTKVKIDIQKVQKDLEDRKNPILVLAGVDKPTLISIESNIKNYPGLFTEAAPQRNYLFPIETFHVVGFVGSSSQNERPFEGKSGLEQEYDTYLRGIPGWKYESVDSVNKKVKALSQSGSLPGKDIYTNIDINLQRLAYKLLKEKVEKKEARAGAIVAQDPRTGGVLALVSYPSVDSNKLSYGMNQQEFEILLKDETYPFFNRAISAAYAPGSVFKMITASAALEEKVIDKYTTIYDEGFIKVGDYTYKNWKLDGSGVVNIFKAIQVSNDTFFYEVSGGYGSQKGVGIKKLSEWAKKYGLGSKTKIDLPGEETGYMPDGQSRDWYLGDTYITGIGQGDVLTTPIQINSLTTYFSNGGFLLRPHIVKNIDGVGDIKTEILDKNIISTENYETIREGLKMALSAGGTGWPFFDFSLKHDGIQLAGKTGTAEYISFNGEEKTHAWFTVFGPFDNANISLTVFLEDGKSGSDDAGPIARELLDEWFK